MQCDHAELWKSTLMSSFCVVSVLQVGPHVRKSDPAAKEVFDSLDEEWGKFDRTVVLFCALCPCAPSHDLLLFLQHLLRNHENYNPTLMTIRPCAPFYGLTLQEWCRRLCSLVVI